MFYEMSKIVLQNENIVFLNYLEYFTVIQALKIIAWKIEQEIQKTSFSPSRKSLCWETMLAQLCYNRIYLFLLNLAKKSPPKAIVSSFEKALKKISIEGDT